MSILAPRYVSSKRRAERAGLVYKKILLSYFPPILCIFPIGNVRHVNLGATLLTLASLRLELLHVINLGAPQPSCSGFVQ